MAADWISVGGEAQYAPLNVLELVESHWGGHNTYVTEDKVRSLDLANGGSDRRRLAGTPPIFRPVKSSTRRGRPPMIADSRFEQRPRLGWRVPSRILRALALRLASRLGGLKLPVRSLPLPLLHFFRPDSGTGKLPVARAGPFCFSFGTSRTSSPCADLPLRLSRTKRPFNQIDRAAFRFRYFRQGCSSLTGRRDDETNRIGRAARRREPDRHAGGHHGWSSDREIRRDTARVRGCCHESSRYLLNVPPRRVRSRRATPTCDPDRSAGRQRPANRPPPDGDFGRRDGGRPPRSTAETPDSPWSTHRRLRPAGSGTFLSACTVGWSGRPARVLACSIAERDGTRSG